MIGAQKMRDIANAIDVVLNGELKGKNRKIGFVLLVHDFHKPGLSNYISNGERKSMIISLEEAALRLRQGRDFSTPEEN